MKLRVVMDAMVLRESFLAGLLACFWPMLRLVVLDSGITGWEEGWGARWMAEVFHWACLLVRR
jgi:hypothetical protein